MLAITKITCKIQQIIIIFCQELVSFFLLFLFINLYKTLSLTQFRKSVIFISWSSPEVSICDGSSTMPNAPIHLITILFRNREQRRVAAINKKILPRGSDRRFLSNNRAHNFCILTNNKFFILWSTKKNRPIAKFRQFVLKYSAYLSSRLRSLYSLSRSRSRSLSLLRDLSLGYGSL